MRDAEMGKAWLQRQRRKERCLRKAQKHKHINRIKRSEIKAVRSTAFLFGIPGRCTYVSDTQKPAQD